MRSNILPCVPACCDQCYLSYSNTGGVTELCHTQYMYLLWFHRQCPPTQRVVQRQWFIWKYSRSRRLIDRAAQCGWSSCWWDGQRAWKPPTLHSTCSPCRWTSIFASSIFSHRIVSALLIRIFKKKPMATVNNWQCHPPPLYCGTEQGGEGGVEWPKFNISSNFLLNISSPLHGSWQLTFWWHYLWSGKCRGGRESLLGRGGQKLH